MMQEERESLNVSAEMNDLVHHAEDWITRGGFNKIPTISSRELHTHMIGNQIVTRAAFLLMEQMGIRSLKDYANHFGEQEIFKNRKSKVVEEVEEEKTMSPVSPMPVEEFRNILRNGVGSPCTPKKRASLMAELVSKIELKNEKTPKKFVIPKSFGPKMPRRSVPEQQPITSTPISKETIRRSSEPLLRKDTPMKAAMKTQALLVGDKTPFENRASRLRRQKIEETRKSLGGGTGLDTSLNSSFLNASFGWK